MHSESLLNDIRRRLNTHILAMQFVRENTSLDLYDRFMKECVTNGATFTGPLAGSVRDLHKCPPKAP